jgi:hypothetical protein
MQKILKTYNLNKAMMLNKNLTQDQLKAKLHYNPDTGQFQYWSYRNLRLIGIGRVVSSNTTSITINHVIYTKGYLAWLYVKGNVPSRRIMFINKDRTDARWENLRLTYETWEQDNKRLVRDRVRISKRLPITHEELTSLLHYNSKTGEFLRLNNPNGVKAHMWNKWDKCYVVCVAGRKYLAHRLAWFYMMGEWSKYDIKHTDRNRRNNNWANLYEHSGVCSGRKRK